MLMLKEKVLRPQYIFFSLLFYLLLVQALDWMER